MGRCVFCGGASHMHVHHIDGDHENNDPGNLAPLCVRCHRVVERYYGAASPEEFAAHIDAAQRRVASGQEPWPNWPEDTGVEDLPLFSPRPLDFVPHREQNFPGVAPSQSRIWRRTPGGREWHVSVRRPQRCSAAWSAVGWAWRRWAARSG